MRHSLIVKFIAVFLCALSLLTAVGSALGMLVLTELNLYNKTVAQVLDERLLSSGQNLAQSEALRYASMTLGGCPENMADQSYPRSHSAKQGITILDAEGNTLYQSGPKAEDAQRTDQFSVFGQYMYLLSEQPDPSRNPAVTEPAPNQSWSPDGTSPLKGAYGLYDAIPAGTVVSVYGITVGYSDGNAEGHGSIDSFGVLFRDAQGRAIFQSVQPGILLPSDPSLSITYIAFRDQEGTTVYEASGLAAVGTISYDLDRYVTFMANTAAADVHGDQDIYRAEFYCVSSPDTICFQVSAQTPIGNMRYSEEGYLHVLIDSLRDPSVDAQGSFPEFVISRVTLYDAAGRKLLDHTGIGTVTTGADLFTLNYQSNEPILALPDPAAETIPVETSAPQETAAAETTAVEETSATEETGETTAQTSTEAAAETTEATAPEETAAPAETTPAETTATQPEETIPAAAETQPPAILPTEPVSPRVTEVPSTEPILINGKPLTEFGISTMSYYSSQSGQWMQASYVYLPMPEYTVQVHSLDPYGDYGSSLTLLSFLRNIRSELFLFLGVSLLLFAIFAVYLCWSAGHKAKTAEIHAGGLNRMPLDLYLILGISGMVLLAAIINYAFEHVLEDSLEVACVLTAGCGFLGSLMIVGFFFASVAQGKTPGGYLWRNSLCGRALSFCVRILLWLKRWITGNTARIFQGCVKLIAGACRLILNTISKFFSWIASLIHRFLSLLPLTWQWILGGLTLLMLCVLSWTNRRDGWGVLWLVLAVALVMYVAHCFGLLLEGAKRMSKGDLDSKVDDKRMLGCFQEFAGDLNDLANVAVVAAQKQLKSERMKTELITNVSHDIKTPLTSIINYVDLLQKPHTEEEGAAYLEVLERQSLRLKKLIEDLMDMSKANTGNMSVDITRLDAVESINQALGEFADKLEKVQLIPVFRHTEEEAMIMADGRLVWRVLSNILSNAVKYAMPGTRLYIDLMSLEGKVLISIKNISRDELSMDAEELMERFVRGDDSRNSDGSGLGLNIAKSLMELQKGQLQLLVDGDLFKVTLIFPGA